MPVYICRWLNGDCSFVSAPTKEIAIERLDQNAGNAEGCPITRVDRFQIHFTLTDDGRLELDEPGIWCWNSVDVEPQGLQDIAYPILSGVLDAIFQETDNKPFTPAQQRRIKQAVLEERRRVKARPALVPATEVGKRLKAELEAPTKLIDKLVKIGAARQLKAFRPKGKPH